MGTHVAGDDDLDRGIPSSRLFQQFRDIPCHVCASLQKERHDHDPVHRLPDTALKDVSRGWWSILQKSMLYNSISA